jgi:hypothetical protein
MFSAFSRLSESEWRDTDATQFPGDESDADAR